MATSFLLEEERAHWERGWFRESSVCVTSKLLHVLRRLHCPNEAAASMERLLDEKYKGELLQSLNELKKSNILCDTTIKTEGKDFPVHRCVLTAASPYFRAMFTSEFRENDSGFVELKNVTGAIMNEIIQFMYTGKAETDSSSAQELIMAADFLMLPSLKLKASKFLEGTISVTNCLALESFARQFNCDLLKQASVSYKMENFPSVVKTDDFKSLDFERVQDLISRDEIVVSKEEEVYEAVIIWVKHEVASRECLLPELLKCVRASSMSKYSLKRIIDREDLVIKDPACMKILIQWLRAFLFQDYVLLQGPRLCLKFKDTVVVLTGGHRSGISTSTTLGFVLATKKWLQLPMMPCPRTRHAAAVCGGQLYVVGGFSEIPLCCFNPVQNEWFSTEKNLPFHPHSALVALNEELYLIGGDSDDKRQVRKYKCNLDQWEFLSPMAFSRAAHCAVVLEELIYVMGGHDDNVCLRSVECYNPANDQWTQILDMNNARKFSAAAAITNGKIIVVGGYSDMGFTRIEETCEIFDKSLNQWSLVSSPTVPRAACGIVSVKSAVYLFGGEDTNNSVYKLDSVECYIVQEDKWIHVSTMPESLSCLQASLIQFPVKHMTED